MIGTHNSLTYYRSKHWWFRPFSFLWRCQNKVLNEQLKNGVRFFDIRIRFDKNNKLRYCHGIVDIDCEFDINSFMYIFYRRGAECRIIIERGNDASKIRNIIDDIYIGSVIKQIIIKDGWKIIYDSLDRNIKDYCYVPFYSDKTFWWNIKHMKFSTIKKWAKSHNPEINNKLKEDNTIIHFIDYLK